MSTVWYVPISKTAKNAELAIRRKTGWKKFEKHPTVKQTQVQILTDGEYYIHCDRKPIAILDHGQFAVLERFNANYPMEEVLEQIPGSFNEHSENRVINCDNCGSYVMTNELHDNFDEKQSAICRICAKKKIAKKTKSRV